MIEFIHSKPWLHYRFPAPPLITKTVKQGHILYLFYLGIYLKDFSSLLHEEITNVHTRSNCLNQPKCSSNFGPDLQELMSIIRLLVYITA